MHQAIEQKIIHFQVASRAFKNNENVTKKLISEGASKSTSIEMAYELQAGEYTRNFNELALKRNKDIHQVINKYMDVGDVNSVGVFGVGEAKNWIGYEGRVKEFHGVELSFSRLQFARSNLTKVPGIDNFNLIKGDASQRIFKNNSFDMAITLHSVEPNGNSQGALMLENVINSSSKYVLLFEPDFSTAPEEMKERMIFHDYVRNIEETISMNDSVSIKEKFFMDVQENDSNLTTCWVLEKKVKDQSKFDYACPFTGCILERHEDFLYSPEAGLAFPSIGNSWCLNKADAIFIGFAEQEM